MKLLLDEMYPATIADQLKVLGHDVASIHDPDFCHLEGAPDEQIFEVAVKTERVLVTANLSDFRRLEGRALAEGNKTPGFVYTTNRQFPRGHPATIGRMVSALAVLLAERDDISTAIFLD